tara:strand:+ start:15 stop:539 length:525 start_codon:yes stop_codon:yes gene_type:complete
MADLVSHVLSAVLVRGRRPADAKLLALISGTILPDLLSRAPLIAWDAMQDAGMFAVVSMEREVMLGFTLPHTPVGLLLIALWIAVLLPQRLADPLSRAAVAGWIGMGGILHLVVDLLQEHLQPGYILLYPFSVRGFELGWMRSDGSVWILPWLALACLWLRVLSRSAKGSARPS